MTLMTRSAMLQMRVTPAVKFASEQVLRRIGITMTEAMELFLRRVIVDEKIPFEVVAMDNATLARIADAVQTEVKRARSTHTGSARRSSRQARRQHVRRGGDRQKRI
jgi:addiction module RelB/DinJ family antitoxin